MSPLIKLDTGTSKMYKIGNSSAKKDNNLLKKRYEHFCRYSTLHGFRDIYDSGNLLPILVWIFLIVAATGLGSYQAYDIIEQHINSPTATQLNVLEDPNPFYPPLRICYPHWLQWMDWDKAKKMGFNRESVLFGVSRLTNIYSERYFDFGRVGEEFYHRLKELNLSNKFQNFFTAVAYDDPPGFTLVTHGSNVTFRKRLTAPRLHLNFMCYELDDNQINVLLNQRTDMALRESSKRMDLIFDSTKDISGSSNVTPDEYRMYRVTSALTLRGTGGKKVEIDSKTWNITFSYPALFYVEGNLEQSVTPTFEDAFVYYVRLGGKVLRWLTTEKAPCRFVRSHYIGYAQCPMRCLAETLQKTVKANCSTYFEAVNSQANMTFEAVCNKQIYFDFEKVILESSQYGSNADFLEMSQICIQQNCRHACEEWVFTAQVTSGPKSFDLRRLGLKTFVEVEYPSDVQILVYEETKIYSLGTFVSAFGGISGLWLGASILSFYQAVYFFCCYRPDLK